MKKLFFIYLLFVFTAFGTIVDNLDIFKAEDETLLSGRITQLKKCIIWIFLFTQINTRTIA